MNHTPGPWEVLPTNAKSYVIAGDDGTYDVAIVRDIGKHNNAANARLIAAAPELLQALKALTFASRHDVSMMTELWAEACVAVNKAEGK